MGTVITVLFGLALVLCLLAVVGTIRPFPNTTRKDSATVALVFFILMIVLSQIMPERTKTTTDESQPSTIGPTRPLPVCTDIPDRLKRLQCEHQRALQAWDTSFPELALAHHRYLETACPSCKKIMQACTDDWYAHKQEHQFQSIPTAEYDRCMDRA